MLSFLLKLHSRVKSFLEGHSATSASGVRGGAGGGGGGRAAELPAKTDH